MGILDCVKKFILKVNKTNTNTVKIHTSDSSSISIQLMLMDLFYTNKDTSVSSFPINFM